MQVVISGAAAPRLAWAPDGISIFHRRMLLSKEEVASTSPRPRQDTTGAEWPTNVCWRRAVAGFPMPRLSAHSTSSPWDPQTDGMERAEAAAGEQQTAVACQKPSLLCSTHV